MLAVTNLRLFAIALIATASCFFASCREKETPETESATQAANGVAADAAVTEKETVQQDSPESLTDEFVVQMDLSLDAMLSAKDKATADEASKKIFSITIFNDETISFGVIEPFNCTLRHTDSRVSDILIMRVVNGIAGGFT